MKRILPCVLLAELILLLLACSFDSKGSPITAYSNPTKALVVLGVQKDFTAETARMPVEKDSVSSMINNINSVQQKFKANNLAIIYVRNVFSRWDIVANLFRHRAAVEGSPGIAFDPRLRLLDDAQFTKSAPDMFSNHELEDFLVQHQISSLYITGLFADQCAYWSSKSALNRKYSVVVISDAVAAASRKIADSALARLQDLGATVKTTEQIMH
jgi:nicotinamidase-related amidase